MSTTINFPTLVCGLVVFGLFFSIIRSIVKKEESDCGSGCSNCSGCGHKSHSNKKKEDR